EVGCLRHDFHDRLTAQDRHNLEGARVDEIPDQHARLVAEYLVRGVTPAPHRGPVDDVIVQERRGVDELDKRRGLDVRGALRGAGARTQAHEERPQPLAAAGNDVFGDLVHEGHGAFQTRSDGRVDGAQVVAYGRANLFQAHLRTHPSRPW